MSFFRPQTWLDRVFVVGIILKGLDGVTELAGGVLLLTVTPQTINRFVILLTRGELLEDPNDWVATHLIDAARHLNTHSLLFVAIYLAVHGIIKIVLVVALLRNQLWAYPWMIIALITFIGYQLYEIALQPTAGLIGLTIFDAAVVALTWREYVVQRRTRVRG